MSQQQSADVPDEVDGEREITHAVASASLSSGDRGTFPLEEFAKRDFQVTGRGTDIALRCQGKTFHAHSVLLCAKSEFFTKACDPQSSFKKTSDFDFDEEEPIAVWFMLSYCYDYDRWGPLQEVHEHDAVKMTREEKLRRTVLAYAIADKYRFIGLKESTMPVFEVLMSTVLKPVLLTEKLVAGSPETDVWISNVGRIIALVFDKVPYTDRRPRRLVLFHLSGIIKPLMVRKIFREEICKVDGFWEELSLFLLVEAGDRPRKCPSCGHRVRIDMTECLAMAKLYECPSCAAKHGVEEWNRAWDVAQNP